LLIFSRKLQEEVKACFKKEIPFKILVVPDNAPDLPVDSKEF
jgi:hypothetical protein